MIKDRLENAKLYYSISERLKQGFEWLKNNDLKNMQPDRYILDGEKLYANLQEYLTKDSAPFEAHRKYIDIQYMIKGEEFIGVNNYKNCQTCEEYNDEKDIEFLTSDGSEWTEILREGDFVVFFPNDSHAPSQKIETNKEVKKVIVKVLI